MDFYNRGHDKGLSGSDVRHRAVLSAVYELPFLRKRGLVTTLFGGWKLGAITSFQAGPAFTVFSGTNQTNAFNPGTVRADVIGQGSLSDSERTLGRWFNTGAFAAPAQFRFGTAGRGTMSGPGLANVDASFIKSFAIRENLRTELRAEFFNLTNHTGFNLPGHSVGTPAFGVISGSRPGRSTQLALRVEF